MRWGFKRRRKAVFSLLLLPILLHFFLIRAEPIFIAQCSNYSNTAFTDLVNRCVAEISKTDDFSGFFDIAKDSSGRISAVEADTARINYVKSQLLINIQNSLNADYPAHISIPLGSLSRYWLISSYGPELKVKIIPISIVSAELDEAFEAIGINQIRHKLYLNISVKMQYRGYAMNETETLKTSVPIAETIISSDVPNFYGRDMLYD